MLTSAGVEERASPVFISAETNPDVLGEIIVQQEILAMPSSNINIHSSGTLLVHNYPNRAILLPEKAESRQAMSSASSNQKVSKGTSSSHKNETPRDNSRIHCSGNCLESSSDVRKTTSNNVTGGTTGNRQGEGTSQFAAASTSVIFEDKKQRRKNVDPGKNRKIKIKRITNLSLSRFANPRRKDATTNEVYDPFSPTDEDNKEVSKGNEERNIYDPFKPTLSDEEKENACTDFSVPLPEAMITLPSQSDHEKIDLNKSAQNNDDFPIGSMLTKQEQSNASFSKKYDESNELQEIDIFADPDIPTATGNVVSTMPAEHLLAENSIVCACEGDDSRINKGHENPSPPNNNKKQAMHVTDNGPRNSRGSKIKGKNKKRDQSKSPTHAKHKYKKHSNCSRIEHSPERMSSKRRHKVKKKSMTPQCDRHYENKHAKAKFKSRDDCSSPLREKRGRKGRSKTPLRGRVESRHKITKRSKTPIHSKHHSSRLNSGKSGYDHRIQSRSPRWRNHGSSEKKRDITSHRSRDHSSSSFVAKHHNGVENLSGRSRKIRRQSVKKYESRHSVDYNSPCDRYPEDDIFPQLGSSKKERTASQSLCRTQQLTSPSKRSIPKEWDHYEEKKRKKSKHEKDICGTVEMPRRVEDQYYQSPLESSGDLASYQAKSIKLAKLKSKSKKNKKNKDRYVESSKVLKHMKQKDAHHRQLSPESSCYIEPDAFKESEKNIRPGRKIRDDFCQEMPTASGLDAQDQLEKERISKSRKVKCGLRDRKKKLLQVDSLRYDQPSQPMSYSKIKKQQRESTQPSNHQEAASHQEFETRFTDSLICEAISSGPRDEVLEQDISSNMDSFIIDMYAHGKTERKKKKKRSKAYFRNSTEMTAFSPDVDVASDTLSCSAKGGSRDTSDQIRPDDKNPDVNLNSSESSDDADEAHRLLEDSLKDESPVHVPATSLSALSGQNVSFSQEIKESMSCAEQFVEQSHRRWKERWKTSSSNSQSYEPSDYNSPQLLHSQSTDSSHMGITAPCEHSGDSHKHSTTNDFLRLDIFADSPPVKSPNSPNSTATNRESESSGILHTFTPTSLKTTHGAPVKIFGSHTRSEDDELPHVLIPIRGDRVKLSLLGDTDHRTTPTELEKVQVGSNRDNDGRLSFGTEVVKAGAPTTSHVQPEHIVTAAQPITTVSGIVHADPHTDSTGLFDYDPVFEALVSRFHQARPSTTLIEVPMSEADGRSDLVNNQSASDGHSNFVTSHEFGTVNDRKVIKECLSDAGSQIMPADELDESKTNGRTEVASWTGNQAAQEGANFKKGAESEETILNPTQILNSIGLNPQQKSAAQNAILSIAELSKHLKLDKIVKTNIPHVKQENVTAPPLVSPSSTDIIESSAVEMYNRGKEQGLRNKIKFQERVAEEAKIAIKPHYERREISKDEYKEIMKRAVTKICSSESTMEVNSVKTRRLIRRYIEKYQHKNALKKERMRSKLSNEISKRKRKDSPPPPKYQPLSPTFNYREHVVKPDEPKLPVLTPNLLKREPRKIVTLPDLPLPPPPPPPPKTSDKR